MKKAFNFKKLLVCVLILVLCLSAFIACNDNDDDQEQPYDPNGINMAVNALKVNVKGRNVNADFTLDNHQVYASVSYPITWSVAITEGETSDVTLTVEGDKTVVHVNGKTKTDVKFTLTARITDAQGVVKTVDIKYTIPAYKLLTHAEYMAAKAGDAVTVQGIVSHYGSKSNGASYNNLFMYDNDGSYYIYSIANSVDPANIQGFHLGAKVEISGTKDIYSGTHEVKDATIKVIDSTLTAQFEDITDIFKSATSVSDAALAAYEYRLVTIKNVTIGEIDDSEKHNYYYFESGNLKTYIRLSTSDCMLNADQQATFKAAFAADNGKLATVKGCVVLYNGQFYINPVDTTPYTVVNTEGKSAQEQVDFATTNNFAPRVVDGSGTTVDLPAQDSIFSNVKIAWTTTNTDIVKIEGSKATFTFTQNGTVKLTATFTHSEDATATATKDFTVSLNVGTPATVAEVNAASKGTTVYVVTGYVVAAGGDHNTAGSFVLADETGTIFSYVGAKVEVGDYVKVIGTRDESYGLAQLKTIAVEQLTGGTFVEATPEDINVASVLVDGSTLYTNKYYKIVAGTLKVNDRFYNLCSGDTTMVSLYANDALKAQLNALDGKTIVVYGYSRGVNTYSKYWQVQVTKVEEAQMTDAEKVATVKATLKDMEVSEDFTLPTSDIATITWTKVSGEGATLEGNHVTIVQTDEDQTVVFKATIVSGEASDTKDITVTIKAKDNRVAGIKGVEGTAYKLVMSQTKANKVVYLLGTIENHYITTSENVDDGIDVYVENVSEDTYRLYTLNGTAKKYIEIVASGSYVNAVFSDEATMTYSWDDSLKTYTAVVGSDTYVLGTRNDKTYTTVGACKTSYNPFYCQLFGTPAPTPVKTNQELVDEAAEALKKDFTITTKASGTTIELAATGINGATIVWKSSDGTVIAIGDLADGKYVATVNVPTENNMTVILTATLTVGEGEEAKTADCEFPIAVTKTLADVVVSLGEITGGTVDVFVGEDKQTLPATLKQENVITLNPVATEGYELVKVFVNGTELNKNDDDKYVYTLGTENVEITATFRKITYVNVSIDENIENGSVTVKVGGVDLDTTKQYRDGDVLTITATANADYKLVAIKVNGEAITGNTYTIKETDTTLEITVEFALEYPVMTIAEFKNATKGTKGQVSGIVTVVDIKAVHIQDAEGNAFYIYYGKNNVPADTFVAGKEYTFKGTKDLYNGLDQMASPILVGEGRDTETVINPTVLDEEAYKKLTFKDSALLVTINGVKYTGGKWMLGETEIAHYEGNAAAANSAALTARVALLKEGVEFDLVGVNVAVNKEKLQVTLNSADQVVIDWVPVVSVDVKEIGIGKTAKITVVADPAVTTDVKATFVSENDAIATVDENGVITGVAAGSVAIKVTANGHTVSTETITVVAAVETFVVTFTKEGTNGSITSVTVDGTEINSGDSVDKGKTINVTVAPAEGYRLASVTVGDGEANTSVAGKTSFELTITEGTTFTVAFEVIPAEPVLAGTFDFTKTTQRKSLNDNQQVWEANGATFTNDKDKSTTKVADYSNPIRLYLNSKVTVACAGMTKLVFKLQGSGNNFKVSYISPVKTALEALKIGMVTESSDGREITLVLTSAQDTIEFTCATQCRLSSLEVYTMA